MNREYLVMFVFIGVTILVAALIFSISDNREILVFNGSGISFSYPSEYTFQEVNSNNGTFLLGSANNKSFNISRTSVNSSFDIYKTELKNNLSANYYIKDQIISINGVEAYQILYVPIAPLGNFFPRNTMIIVDKDNTRYTLSFAGEETLNDIPLILKNFQIY